MSPPLKLVALLNISTILRKKLRMALLIETWTQSSCLGQWQNFITEAHTCIKEIKRCWLNILLETTVINKRKAAGTVWIAELPAIHVFPLNSLNYNLCLRQCKLQLCFMYELVMHSRCCWTRFVPSLETEHLKPAQVPGTLTCGFCPSCRETAPGPNLTVSAADGCCEGYSCLYFFLSVETWVGIFNLLWLIGQIILRYFRVYTRQQRLFLVFLFANSFSFVIIVFPPFLSEGGKCALLFLCVLFFSSYLFFILSLSLYFLCSLWSERVCEDKSRLLAAGSVLESWRS